MKRIKDMDEDKLTQALAYAGYILLAFELVKSLVVKPVKQFYAYSTFGVSMPFKSYNEDVAFRHKNEFEACLLYLHDFMEAIDSDDLLAIQKLRKHRNDLAHNLPVMLPKVCVEENRKLLDDAHKALFKLSNYEAYKQVGSEPALHGVWNTAKGHEYLILEAVNSKAKLLGVQIPEAPAIIESSPQLFTIDTSVAARTSS